MTETATAPDVQVEDDDVQLVLDTYDAFARGDIAGVAAHLHEDVEWVLADGTSCRGPLAVADRLNIARERWRQLRSMPLARRLGDRIVVEHHLEGVLADGTDHAMTVADVHSLRDGLVAHMRSFADPADVTD